MWNVIRCNLPRASANEGLLSLPVADSVGVAMDTWAECGKRGCVLTKDQLFQK